MHAIKAGRFFAAYGTAFGTDRRSNGKRRTAVVTVAVLLASLIAIVVGARPAAAAGSSCGVSVNAVACENAQTSGVTDQSDWDISGAGDDDIQGFSTDISVNAGASVGFKIDTTLSAYTINVYRLGYYGGHGARLWASNLTHTVKHQPACLTDPSTLLYDCGNWSTSATWSVPSNAVSGVYIALLTSNNGDSSHITFIVRNDASTSDIVYQTSDPTWEAYNTYGGSDFYQGTDQLSNSQARAFKISYNRPFATRGWVSGRDFLFSNEYPTIRYLERNGYDVSYISGVDTDRYGATQLTNHKVFMSVGHDEYWSQAQRTNVEHARDAGVSLMFLSGNEVYWHTRYESSIDGTNTPYRTLVTYKEAWDQAPTDPTGESTSTWRDPRYGNAPGGANPENGLTGTMYMANDDDLPVTVTQAQGKTRLWRNTGLSSMTTASTALAPHTVGYESDEDVDNGFRPAGLVDLSTTVGTTPQLLQDFGLITAPGTTTHHLTLYRAASGALVFGAGTIQWGWGLDQDHDGDNSAPADVRMQQATANMLADMKALPTTLMAGLTMPSTSTDTQAPTVTINTPAANATLANGTSVTVTGTASDLGGGQVAGVEVSLDNGTTWHPATGTTSFSYTGIIAGDGASAVKVRATDDSANTSAPKAVALSVNCPCSIFGARTPKTVDSGDAGAVELGLRFTSSTDGYVSGIRFYKATANTGSHTGTLWTTSGQPLASGVFTSETASGWQTLQFASPVAITADTTYVASYYAPNGHYSADSLSFYYKDLTAAPLSALHNTPDGTSVNGVFNAGHGFPASSFKATNYYVDVLFTGSSTIAPTVVGRTPGIDAGSVAVTATPTITFSKAMNAATITFTLKDESNNPVAGTVTYDAPSKTAKFTPGSALAQGTLYTATVTGSDINGNPLAAPASWSFRTIYPGQVGNGCPCTLFTDATVPSVVTEPDSASVELGVKFTADTDGIVTGVKFYKGPQNLGSHTGTLWSSTGQQLASAVFTNESSSGWQTVTFASPVTVTAGATYVASYHTSMGYYSATPGAYATSGLDNFPLHVPVNGGVYTYASAFPSSNSSADYGVDVIFTVPASLVPTVSSTTPAAGDLNISTTAGVTAQFNTSVLAGTTTMTLTGPGGVAVAGAAALDALHKSITFTPSAALAVGKVYTATVSGARSLAGTPLTAPVTWQFTTGGGACPCSIFPTSIVPGTVDSGDASAVTLGMKVVSDTSGTITGIRFYKSAANTGVHTGSVWDGSGARLGTVTFSNESGSGWQTATFSTPVAITAGVIYTVGYFAPNGHYSADSHYFDNTLTVGPLSVPGGTSGTYFYGSDSAPNGIFNNTNYWVEPIVSLNTAVDTTAPTVTGTTPIDGASSVAASVTPSASFSEPVPLSSVTMTLKNAGGTNVAGTVSLDPTGTIAKFTPSAALTAGATYSVTLNASDKSGNALAAPLTWSFRVAAASTGSCPCSVWDDSATPAVISDPDPSAVELGLQFSADRDGQITGARFYKGPLNTGTHTATLWTSTGQSLTSGIFTGESSTGWQTLTFTTPVTITAGTTYVISYHTDAGRFSATAGAFATAGVDNVPLHVAAHAGLYAYGPGGVAPSGASDANYWVDPVFVPSVALDITPPVIGGVTSTAAGTAETISWTTDEPATTSVAYGVSPSALTSTATAAGLTAAHTVSLPGLSSSTTYYYRVTSADAAGNSATSPVTSGAPASFTSADTTAPVVTQVAASGSGSTASVTWTTNEASTSRVDYGVTATALTGSATTAGSVTAHTVALTGLAVNTRYYYRVTSADAAGNSTTSPATSAAAAVYVPTVTPMQDVTTANFAAGTPGTTTYVTADGDGGVVLAPTTATEFTAATIPSGWSLSTISGGSATYSGNATLRGATLSTSTGYSTAKSLEFVGTLNKNQSVGWAASASSSTKFAFSVNSSNQLIATVADGFLTNSTFVVASGWVAASHNFKIDWNSGSATFYLDGTSKWTKTFSTLATSSMRPVFSDSTVADAPLVLDWARVAPYAQTGTFTSRIIDASTAVAWDALSWDAVVPAGTTMVVKVRTGNTATPDGTWSAYTTIAATGGAIAKTSRYLQYQLVLTSSGTRYVTPTIKSVTMAYHVL